MSDIIANAQKLLGGTTPGEWVAIPHYDWGNAKVIAPDDEPGVCEIATMGQENFDLADAKLMAASKSHAQALAEETYEYAVQVKIGAKWLFLGRGTGGHNFARNAFWFVKKENAQDYMVIGKDMSAPARLVCRRVSPVEVINE